MQTFGGLRFEWDEYEQNMILGCFFWGYVLTELPGGRLAEIIGGHRVFGYSMLSASVLTLLTPFAARLDFLAVVVLRVLLGLMLVIYSSIDRSAAVIKAKQFYGFFCVHFVLFPVFECLFSVLVFLFMF